MAKNEKRTCRLIASVVELHRHERGWSQEEFAKATGLDVKTLGRIAKMEKVYLSTARRVADALNVSLASLLLHPLKQPPEPRQNGAYKFSISTVGLIDSPEQFELIGEIAKDIVKRLADSGVVVDVHQQTLHGVQIDEKGPYALVTVIAQRENAFRGFIVSLDRLQSLSLVLLHLDEYEVLRKSLRSRDQLGSYLLTEGYWRGSAIASDSLSRELKLIRSLLRRWCNKAWKAIKVALGLRT